MLANNIVKTGVSWIEKLLKIVSFQLFNTDSFPSTKLVTKKITPSGLRYTSGSTRRHLKIFTGKKNFQLLFTNMPLNSSLVSPH